MGEKIIPSWFCESVLVCSRNSSGVKSSRLRPRAQARGSSSEIAALIHAQRGGVSTHHHCAFRSSDRFIFLFLRLKGTTRTGNGPWVVPVAGKQPKGTCWKRFVGHLLRPLWVMTPERIIWSSSHGFLSFFCERKKTAAICRRVYCKVKKAHIIRRDYTLTTRPAIWNIQAHSVDRFKSIISERLCRSECSRLVLWGWMWDDIMDEDEKKMKEKKETFYFFYFLLKQQFLQCYEGSAFIIWLAHPEKKKTKIAVYNSLRFESWKWMKAIGKKATSEIVHFTHLHDRNMVPGTSNRKGGGATGRSWGFKPKYIGSLFC